MLMKHFSFLLMNFYKYSLRISYVLVKKNPPPNEQRYLLREYGHGFIIPGTMNRRSCLDQLVPVGRSHVDILQDR